MWNFLKKLCCAMSRLLESIIVNHLQTSSKHPTPFNLNSSSQITSSNLYHWSNLVVSSRRNEGQYFKSLNKVAKPLCLKVVCQHNFWKVSFVFFNRKVSVIKLRKLFYSKIVIAYLPAELMLCTIILQQVNVFGAILKAKFYSIYCLIRWINYAGSSYLDMLHAWLMPQHGIDTW